MTADRSPRTASMTDFRRFFGQLLRDSREACREEPGGAWAGLPPVEHAGNRRLQFHNAIVSEAFLRSFFLRARHSETRDLLILLQPARQQFAARPSRIG